ncbi:hypothetical protein C8T65DRAFT_634937 [Cerioporus squamosus]|nr:hypothetical protein C8T65DRAFT_634937 [Cerioporus squamosus]
MPDPLPPLTAALRERLAASDPTAATAYELVLDAEQATPSARPQDAIAIRVLGQLLLHPVSEQALHAVACDVHLHASLQERREELCALGMRYLGLILAFRKRRGPGPPLSESSDLPSRTSFEAMRGRHRALAGEPPADPSTARKLALLRDNYCCMLTGAPDLTYGWPLAHAGSPPFQITVCCHIFPEARPVRSFDSDRADVQPHPRAVLSRVASTDGVRVKPEARQRFGYAELQDELSGPNVHRLENVLTLSHMLHVVFDKLGLWLEEVPGKPHTYRVKFAPRYAHVARCVPEEVRFVAHAHEDGLELPLPSRKYLRIHAACCRVAHLSGAAAYVDAIEREREELQVLAEDGGSARVLEFALAQLRVMQGV